MCMMAPEDEDQEEDRTFERLGRSKPASGVASPLVLLKCITGRLPAATRVSWIPSIMSHRYSFDGRTITPTRPVRPVLKALTTRLDIVA
jgi:hypothetical protein